MKTVLTITWILLATVSVAQEQGQKLDVQTTVQKEVVSTGADGEMTKELVSADAVAPGEKIYYTITFRNVGDAPADNVVITNPIASSLFYVDGSAFGPGTDIEFSVDGGTTFAAADILTVTENGEQRAADGGDFTHVRWVMKNNLAAGAQGTARFAAILE